MCPSKVRKPQIEATLRGWHNEHVGDSPGVDCSWRWRFKRSQGLGPTVTVLLLPRDNVKGQRRLSWAEDKLEINVPASDGRVEKLRVQAAAAAAAAGFQPVMVRSQHFKDQGSIYKEILELFLLPSAVQIYWNADFILQQGQRIYGEEEEGHYQNNPGFKNT